MRSFHRGRNPELMTINKRVAGLVSIAVLGTGYLSLIGCDYWPPALQDQIEALHAELNDALDERQQLDTENTELKALQASLQREVEEKARENEGLRHRLMALTGAGKQPPPLKRASLSRVDSSQWPVMKGTYAFLQLERPPMKGPRVVQLQRLLRRHDLPIRVDGIYGRDMAAAVRSFQRVHGLPADGIVGPATTAALHRLPRLVRPVRQLWLHWPPAKGQDVFVIQRALRRAGYRLAVDGHFGRETEVVVVRFQRAHGLHPDGVVGPKTWHALSRSTR
ncbi:MAG: hypothetical protein EWM72_02071 [Nitrospira sp.]|nr:MAG: hypothetical protein EWM72_02071 [Nitrospira sp.]